MVLQRSSMASAIPPVTRSYCSLFVAIFALNIVLELATCSPSLVITFESGDVRGRTQQIPGGATVLQFLGVPFAEPPTGKNRFQPPKPVKPWTGVRDATTFANRCPQNNAPFPLNVTEGPKGEDCLYLNIYRPAANQQNLAVMLWIHGGALYVGSGNDYDPSILAGHNDVIVVTINYRLGLLGFLYHPGTELKGNYGMLDQVEALKWVQRNIAHFGGNPGSVTIFGESSGAASVTHHVTSPLSAGLFHRGIAQSGTSLAAFGFYSASDTAFDEKYIHKLGCQVEGGNLLGCLQSKNVGEIMKLYENMDIMRIGRDYPIVTVDGYFMPREPETLFKDGTINKVPIIIGENTDEGSFNTMFIAQNKVPEEINMELFEKIVREGLFTTNGDSSSTKEAILYQYTDHENPNSTERILENIRNLMGDSWTYGPKKSTADYLSKSGVPTYFYVFSHRTAFSVYPESYGVNHMDEIPFVFGFPWKRPKTVPIATDYTYVERGLSTSVMKLWTNFAKNGDPTSPMQGGVTWPLYTPEQQQYLDIGLVPKVKRKYLAERVAFWNELVAKLESKACNKNMNKRKAEKDEL